MTEERNPFKTTALIVVMLFLALGCEQTEPKPLDLVPSDSINRDLILNCSGAIVCDPNRSGGYNCYCEEELKSEDLDDLIVTWEEES